MIIETIVVGLAAIGVGYYAFTDDYRRFKKYSQRWYLLMDSLGMRNKFDKTYEVEKITLLENGIVFMLDIPAGFSVKRLEAIKEEIDTFYKGITTIRRLKFNNKCIVKIITKDISDFKFEPVKCKEYELYIGKRLDLENYILDLTKAAAHVLIGAPSGKGKSFLLASILTNLIYNSSNKIELYLLQLMKADVSNFENCRCVKYTAYTLEEIRWGLKKAVEIIEERDKKFRAVGINNLKNYNKHYPNSKLKRMYLITEEISFFMKSDADVEDVKAIKAECLEYLKTIVKAGRSSGVHLISVTQRSTIENIPATMKSMMIRISLGQISSIDSRNIIESDDAIYLDDKECIIYGDNPDKTPVRIPTVDEDFRVLNKYVPEIKIPIKLKEKDNKTNEILKEEPKEVKENNEAIELVPNNIIDFPKAKNEEFNFEGPKFKVLDLEESAIDSNEEKKLKCRKGVYVED